MLMGESTSLTLAIVAMKEVALSLDIETCTHPAWSSIQSTWCAAVSGAPMTWCQFGNTPVPVMLPVMLPSATLAAEINRFVDDLQETGSYTGVAAFVVFALLKQLRVFVWYGSQREDIIAKYAPWASTQIPAATPFEAIACRLSVSDAGVVSHHIVEDPREVNPWVACVDQGGRHGDGAEADDEETLTFQAMYLSFNRIVTWTVCDGDCGMDVVPHGWLEPLSAAAGFLAH